MKAWKLLNNQKKWIRGRSACDKDGYHVDADSTQAVRFCAMGALIHVAYTPTLKEKVATTPTTLYKRSFKKLDDYISTNTKYSSIIQWNDNPNQCWRQVYNVLKKLDI